MNRRGFLRGLVGAVAAPLIVPEPRTFLGWLPSLEPTWRGEPGWLLTRTGWTWRQVGANVSCDARLLDEMMAETVDQCSEALARSVARQNVLLMRLGEGGKLTVDDVGDKFWQPLHPIWPSEPSR